MFSTFVGMEQQMGMIIWKIHTWSWSQGREFESRMGPLVVSLSKDFYPNLPLSTQVYKWVPA